MFHTNDFKFQNNFEFSVDFLSLPMVTEILNDPDDKRKVCKRSGIDLTVNDFQSLKPGVWLNGEVIETFLKETASSIDMDVDVFSTYLTSVIAEQDGVARAARTFRKQLSKLQGKKMILFPIFLKKERHWALAVKYLGCNELFYYDSLMYRPTAILNKVISVLSSAGIDVSEINYVVDAPKQDNGIDCGVFTCATGYCLLKGKELSYHQGMIHNFRHFIVANLLEEKVDIPNVNRFREPYIFPELLEDNEDSLDCDDDEAPNNLVEDHQKNESEDVNKLRKELIYLNIAPKGCMKDNNHASKIIQPLQVKTSQVDPSVTDTKVSGLQESLSNLYLKGSHRMKVDDNELIKLRKGDEAFIDVDMDGNEFTQNMFSNWRRSLKLSEILRLLGSDAWNIIENEAHVNPKLFLSWINKVSPDPTARGPTNFSFGSKDNYDIVKGIMERIYSPMVIKDPHLTYRQEHQKRRRQRKSQRKTPYQVFLYFFQLCFFFSFVWWPVLHNLRLFQRNNERKNHTKSFL